MTKVLEQEDTNTLCHSFFNVDKVSTLKKVINSRV